VKYETGVLKLGLQQEQLLYLSIVYTGAQTLRHSEKALKKKTANSRRCHNDVPVHNNASLLIRNDQHPDDLVHALLSPIVGQAAAPEKVWTHMTAVFAFTSKDMKTITVLPNFRTDAGKLPFGTLTMASG
jgi:hypothetical protein